MKTENIETFFLVSVFKVPTERPLQHVNEEKYLENKPEKNFLQENLHRYGVTVMFFMWIYTNLCTSWRVYIESLLTDYIKWLHIANANFINEYFICSLRN